jgi:hypothetical protein
MRVASFVFVSKQRDNWFVIEEYENGDYICVDGDDSFIAMTEQEAKYWLSQWNAFDITRVTPRQ